MIHQIRKCKNREIALSTKPEKRYRFKTAIMCEECDDFCMQLRWVDNSLVCPTCYIELTTEIITE